MESGSGGGGDSDKQTLNEGPATTPPAEEPLPRADSNRTLSDIIQEEGGGGGDNGGGKKGGGRGSKDKIRRSNSGKGNSFTSTVHVPASDIPLSRNMSRTASNRTGWGLDAAAQADIPAVRDPISPSLLRNPSMASGKFNPTGPMSSMRRLQRESNDMEDDDEDEEEDEEEGEGEEDEDGGGGEGKAAAAVEGAEQQPPVRMSLMSLLAETDPYMMDDDEEEEEDDDDGGVGGADYNNCCVCMVRHKGTAFVPCGHSFCRLCSRELVVDTQNCPLCNNYILEILDIF